MTKEWRNPKRAVRARSASEWVQARSASEWVQARSASECVYETQLLALRAGNVFSPLAVRGPWAAGRRIDCGNCGPLDNSYRVNDFKHRASTARLYSARRGRTGRHLRGNLPWQTACCWAEIGCISITPNGLRPACWAGSRRPRPCLLRLLCPGTDFFAVFRPAGCNRRDFWSSF